MIFGPERAIFVHIQKTGGTSICSALGRNDEHCPEKHYLARDLPKIYGEETWKAFFKFAFVRNPWDRLVSWWSMIDEGRDKLNNGTDLNKFWRFVLERARTFEEFLDNCDEEIIDNDGPKWIYRNQIDHLVDESGQLMVDFVGRFERLQDDFDIATKNFLGYAITLPNKNVSSHRHYTEYYSPERREQIGRRFEQDIDRFGYVFGP